MLVTKTTLPQVCLELDQHKELSLDCETTGLNPFHGDKLFSIIIASKDREYYFNYHSDHDEYLGNIPCLSLELLFSSLSKTWIFFNARFDLHFLEAFGYRIKGKIIDTRSWARILYPHHQKYNLKSVAERLGFQKLDIVEDYIKENDLTEKREIFGNIEKVKRFDLVPLEVVQPYAEKDGRITYDIFQKQKEEIEKRDEKERDLFEIDSKLSAVVQRIERRGLRIDRDYAICSRNSYEERKGEAEAQFQRDTGFVYAPSPKLYKQIFGVIAEKWTYTKKGNPSFESEVLTQFDTPIARTILEIRDCKSHLDFLNAIYERTDSRGYVHPSLDQAGTITGRFSSYEPNFQNLTNEEGNHSIRGCVIPSPDCKLVEIDYKAMEFRALLDYAYESDLSTKVMAGEDPHQATATLLGITRKHAKTLNFALIYGIGAEKLSGSLGVSLEEAKEIKQRYFSGLPGVKRFLYNAMETAKNRGSVFNRFGRRYYFEDSSFCYRAPNYLIQGGCSDAVKIAMCEIDRLLSTYQTKMILQVHDSLLFDLKNGEEFLIDDFKSIMNQAYPSTVCRMDTEAKIYPERWTK